MRVLYCIYFMHITRDKTCTRRHSNIRTFHAVRVLVFVVFGKSTLSLTCIHQQKSTYICALLTAYSNLSLTSFLIFSVSFVNFVQIILFLQSPDIRGGIFFFFFLFIVKIVHLSLLWFLYFSEQFVSLPTTKIAKSVMRYS